MKVCVRGKDVFLKFLEFVSENLCVYDGED